MPTLTQLIAKAWSMRKEFIKYFAVGVSAVVLDMSTLIAATELLNLTPVIATVLNQILILAYVFFTNKYWSFRNTEMPQKQMVRFVSLAIFNYFFSVAVMYIFHGRLDFDYRLVRLGTIAVMVMWNFVLYKYWVYRAEKTVVDSM